MLVITSPSFKQCRVITVLVDKELIAQQLVYKYLYTIIEEGEISNRKINYSEWNQRLEGHLWQ